MIFEVFPADIARAMVRLVMTPQMLSKLTAVFKQLSAKLTSLFNITFVDQVPMLIPLDKTNKIYFTRFWKIKFDDRFRFNERPF